VPIHQYPGMPHHQIEHIHVQRMRHLRSSSPPPIQHQPPLLPLPVPLSFPQLPQSQRVDYTARLIQNFNSDHQRRRSRCSNHVSTVHPANAQAGPMHLPSIPRQNVINFQHEADQQALAEAVRQQQALLQRQWEHQRSLEYQRYLEHQRQAQLQRQIEMQAQ
jgi:hypothetical protein